jgi:hypothetical protein
MHNTATQPQTNRDWHIRFAPPFFRSISLDQIRIANDIGAVPRILQRRYVNLAIGANRSLTLTLQRDLGQSRILGRHA